MNVEKLYLCEFNNGNRVNFVFIEFNGINGCNQLFKSKKIETMAQFINDEYAPCVSENSIITDKLPCIACTKRKCKFKYDLDIINKDIVDEIFSLVTAEQSDNVSLYLEAE